MIALPPLYLITDGARVGEARVLEALERAVRGGLTMVQVREKHLSDWELERFVERVRRRVPSDTRLILNRGQDLVEAMDLAGVHLGGDPWRIADARELLSSHRLVGYSAHSAEEVELACELGADYVSFSPVFKPTSKTSPLPPAGVEGLRAACRVGRLPVFALGGITEERVPRVRQAGAWGVAVIGAILDAPDPEEATRGIFRSWNATPAGGSTAGVPPAHASPRKNK